ncbi:MAG: metallophosphoesterase [Flavobacteriales bacterium]|nr:metallophosphoesterase [Flavobacteriales bacterium]
MKRQKEGPTIEELSSKCLRVNKLVVVLLLIAQIGAAQTVNHSLYLIGDAGKDTTPGPALRMLEEELKANPTSSVIFLGDNIYPAGLEGKDGAKKKRMSELKLLSQLERTANHQGYVFWVPGNHDWKAGRWQGHWLVKQEADFVEKYYAERGTIKNDSGEVFFPKLGLPGPHVAELPELGYNLITLDVQWWLQDQFFHKVPTEGGLSKKKMEQLFLQQLDSALARSSRSGLKTIIAAHHPMYSNGHHGDSKQPLRFIFNWVPPFQLFGLIGLNRALVQDIPQPRYKRIRNRMLSIINKYQGVLYVSGHDHNLQFIKKDENFHLVSGAGSKRSSLSGDKFSATYMDDQNYGFMRLDMMDSGRIKCYVFGHTTGDVIHSFWVE